MNENEFKAPLKNGILVMLNPKTRKTEFVDLFELEIVDARKKGFVAGFKVGEYFQLLEHNISELREANQKLKSKLNTLIEHVKEINGRSFK